MPARTASLLRPRVALVIELDLFRDALVQALRKHRLEIVEGTASADVIVVDVSAPRGIENVAELAQATPDARILAVAVNDEDREILACIEAGAIGYVLRGASVGELADAAQRAVRDEPHATPHVVASLMRRVAALSPNGGRPVSALTSRELEVVELIEQGLSNKEIAARLSIAVTTVKNHVHSILEKLHVRRRGEAASLVRRSR